MGGQRSRRLSRRIRPDGVDTGSRHLPKGIVVQRGVGQGQGQLPHTSSFSSGTVREDPKLCPVTGIHSDFFADYYVFSTELGNGHYGCVHKCRHRRTGELYAVKSVDKSKVQRLDYLQREVYLLRKMNHRGIMKMVDCYEDPDHLRIVTELYTGGELFDRIREQSTPDGCMSEETAAGIVASLLKAVVYLHKNSIVHRDIKPENILFESSSEGAGIRLVDFGLSRRHKPADAAMTNPVGTAYYMAPEVLEHRYDRACDVWSVGIITYIMLCGYPPFNGESDEAIFSAIRQGRFQFPERAWSSKSKEAKSFVNSLLTLDPVRRWSAAEALNHPWIKAHSLPRTRDHCAATKSRIQDSLAVTLDASRQTTLKLGTNTDDVKQEDSNAKIKALRHQIKKLRISVHPRAA